MAGERQFFETDEHAHEIRLIHDFTTNTPASRAAIAAEAATGLLTTQFIPHAHATALARAVKQGPRRHFAPAPHKPGVSGHAIQG